MNTNGQPVIQTVGLTKSFRDFWHRQRVIAVDNLDIEVYQNEVFGLLGPNGSGKSTTIKMLLGLLYPTRGRIQVLGRAPTDVAVKALIGYLPEESYLYRFLNPRETLDYYGRLFQIPRQDRRRRVEQLLEMVGLQREPRRRVGEYSKGMARRIGLAQALINDPDLLILDEPTTGLDPIGTREIKDLIVFLNREKRKTILLCSHLLADVEDVCQRVTVLYGGRRQAVGHVRELLVQQDLTQITAQRSSEDMIRRIRQLIESEDGKQVLEITTPYDRLETFFLRIVREAQAARQITSGVTAGGQIADFLAAREQEGEALVESLLDAAEPKQPEPVAAPPQAPAKPDEAVVESLLDAAQWSGGTEGEDAKLRIPPSLHPSVPPSSSDEPDRGLIDQLVHRDHDANRDQAKE